MALWLPIVVKRGDTLRRTLTIRGADGNPVNLAGATVVMHLREPNGTTDLFPITLPTAGPAANGQVDLVIPVGQINTLTLDEYGYEVEMTKGGEPSTPVEGVFIMLPDKG